MKLENLVEWIDELILETIEHRRNPAQTIELLRNLDYIYDLRILDMRSFAEYYTKEVYRWNSARSL